MPISGTMDLDLRDIDAGFRKIADAGKNLRKVWNKLSPKMKADQLQHWQDQTGPDGKWLPRAESTRKRHGRRRKIFSKRFAKGFAMFSSPRELAAISKIPWADSQQFGGKVGNKATLPARPFLYLSEEFIGIALPEISKHLEKAWRR